MMEVHWGVVVLLRVGMFFVGFGVGGLVMQVCVSKKL